MSEINTKIVVLGDKPGKRARSAFASYIAGKRHNSEHLKEYEEWQKNREKKGA